MPKEHSTLSRRKTTSSMPLWSVTVGNCKSCLGRRAKCKRSSTRATLEKSAQLETRSMRKETVWLEEALLGQVASNARTVKALSDPSRVISPTKYQACLILTASSVFCKQSRRFKTAKSQLTCLKRLLKSLRALSLSLTAQFLSWILNWQLRLWHLDQTLITLMWRLSKLTTNSASR